MNKPPNQTLSTKAGELQSTKAGELHPGASDPFIRWSYDKVGNRLTEQRPTGTTSYSYDQMDRMLSAGATSYTYDRNGNQLTAGSRTFTYDLANRTRTTSASGTTTTYSYDGDGKRLQASTGNSPNAKTNFLWDTTTGLPQLVLERNGNNALQRRYVNAGGRPLYWSTSSTTANYLHWDPLGSVRNVTNASGAIQLTYDYEPYGTIRTSSGTLTNFVKFTGQYQDPTGLYHLRARQYDPASGRFTATDPAGQTIGGGLIGPYQYAAGQPTVMVDPAGTWSTRADVASSAAETAASGYEPLVLVRPTCPSGTRWFSELGRCVEVNAGVVEPPFVRVPRIAIRLGSWAWRAIRGAKAAKAGASALEEASEAAFRASRGPINISRKHYPGAGGRHSKFEQGVDIDATVREALQSPGAIFRPNRNAAGDIIPGYRIYTDLGRTVGTRGETGLRTIVSPDGRVITSFPGKPWG